jgi:1-acyl-sn-glycerol-3-phosphate acyltransferase
MTIFRSTLFYLGFIVSTLLYAIPCVLVRILPYRWCFAFVSSWCTFNVHWLRLTCGIKYKITGLENIPSQACVIMSNHQSTWETLAYPSIFPTLTWVIKKELLYIPFFGWGIASVQPIALDRKQGKKSIRQLISDGKSKLSLGRFLLIFPEGTRIPYGETRPLKAGGFVLAKEANVSILPVAHDAGRLWPRNRFLKKPGTIQVHIGQVITSKDRSAEALRDQYAQWLSDKRAEMYKSAMR